MYVSDANTNQRETQQAARPYRQPCVDKVLPVDRVPIVEGTVISVLKYPNSYPRESAAALTERQQVTKY